MKSIDRLEPPDQGPSQSIATALRHDRTIVGYGRQQHGMNGKDADLDPAGQLMVKGIQILDPIKSKHMEIEIAMLAYADVCEPCDDDEAKQEAMRETAQDIVCEADAYAGEWTGSDYWCFSHPFTVRVRLTVEEYEKGDGEKNISRLADRVAKAIYSNKEGRDFARFAIRLNKQLDDLHKEVIDKPAKTS